MVGAQTYLVKADAILVTSHAKASELVAGHAKMRTSKPRDVPVEL
jgi:hypothetical protein